MLPMVTHIAKTGYTARSIQCCLCLNSDGVPPVVPPNAEIEMTVQVLEHEGVSHSTLQSHYRLKSCFALS
jgi:hypothetical protein